VLYENRPIGETKSNGKLLVPNLRAYGSNKISIDPKALGVNDEIETTEEVVAPADRSGVWSASRQDPRAGGGGDLGGSQRQALSVGSKASSTEAILISWWAMTDVFSSRTSRVPTASR